MQIAAKSNLTKSQRTAFIIHPGINEHIIMENRADQLLEAHFANTLTESEARELQILVSEDPAVAAELAFQQQIASAARSQSLAESIQDTAWRAVAQKPFPSGAVKARMWSRYAFALAAALALMIVAYRYMQPPSLQTVVADNAKAYPNKMKFKSLGNGDEVTPPEVIRAFQLYDNQNYSATALALQPIVAANLDRVDYRFYWGVSLLKSNQYPAAVTALTPATQGQHEYQVPALYYLGLACAGSGDPACARQNLKAYLESPDGVTFRTQAKAVLDKL